MSKLLRAEDLVDAIVPIADKLSRDDAEEEHRVEACKVASSIACAAATFSSHLARNRRCLTTFAKCSPWIKSR